MDARANTKEPKLWSYGEQQYLLFNQPQTHFGNSRLMKRVATDALERARVKRFKSLVLETMSEDPSDLLETSDENHDVKSDADSSYCHPGDVTDGVSEDEKYIDELLNDQGTRKKLTVLARMVGVASTEPGAVLAEVVRVLKDFKRADISLFK